MLGGGGIEGYCRRGDGVPMYLDLNVELMSSAGMLRAAEVAVLWTSCRPTVGISMAVSYVR